MPGLLQDSLRSLLLAFRNEFNAPTFENFLVLFVGAVISQGSRTVSEMIRACGNLAGKHFTVYHCFLSRANWSALAMARILAGIVINAVPDDEVVLVVDDTTERRSGPKVHGVACHRDAVRSTEKHLVLCFGHKWVVTTILVKFSFAARPWALPIIVTLYRPAKQEKADKLRHRTLIDWAKLHVAFLVRWFPSKKFVLVGDGGYSSVELARFCVNRNAELVGRLRLDSALYAPPPPREPNRRGRPAQKGGRINSPKQEAQSLSAEWHEEVVTWYGGKQRDVKLLTGTALRYVPCTKPVPVQWVLVRDPEGKLRDETFFSTNVNRPAQDIVGLYVQRWSVETTFQELRTHLGIESTRNRVRLAVQRTVPCLCGLFSIISIWYGRHLATNSSALPADPWYAKTEPTFSDAIAALRLDLLSSGIMFKCSKNDKSIKIPKQLWDYACQRLSRSA